jgi:acyl-CoA synthetase (NDP forming)
VIEMMTRARSEGRRALLETEALRIAAGLGIATPAHTIVGGPTGPIDLGFVGGDRVVVKALAPGLAHKTESGAVVTVPARDDVVLTAIEEMSHRVPDAEAFLLADHVDHDAGPGGEYLLGMRHTDAFGPIVTLGFGGTAIHLLAELSSDGVGAIMSPDLRDGAWRSVASSPAAGPLLRGLRGAPPLVTEETLRDLLDAALDLAAAGIPDSFVEFEVNPLVFVGGTPVALDAVCRLLPEPSPVERPDLPAGAIDALLRPRTIGIVGVSRGANPGRVILGNVLGAGFRADDLVVVKPGLEEIDGVRCVGSIEEMGSVDALVVAVGADEAARVLRTVTAESAARSVILIPGGIGERYGTAEAAASLAADLATAPDPRPIVNGPNCMGIRSVPGRYDTTFIPDHKQAPTGRTGRHPVALVSASGAFVLAQHDRLPWLDPRYVITVGNQIDVTVGDHVDHLAGDPEVRVVACYVEGFRPGDGTRFLKAAERVRERGGRVLLYHAGRTTEGVDAAASHTAAIAGEARVTVALARAAGALVAETLDEFEDLLRLAVLLDGREIGGRRLAAVSNAGFEAVAIADNLGELQLARLGPTTTDRLTAILERGGVAGMVTARNPLDLTPSCGVDAYVDAAETILADPEVDVAVVGCLPFTPSLDTLEPGAAHREDVGTDSSLPSRLAESWRGSTTPWVAVVDAGSLYDAMARRLEDAGVPTFRRSDRAVRALSIWVNAG